MASARAAGAAQNKAKVTARKAKERMGPEAIRSRWISRTRGIAQPRGRGPSSKPLVCGDSARSPPE